MVPKCRKCSEPIPAPPMSPVWADPRAMMSMGGVKIEKRFASPGVVSVIASADPKRLMIGFACGVQNQFYVAPHNEPQHGGWLIGSQNQGHSGWFTLFTHGPIVNYEWWITEDVGASIFVYEVYRLQ